MSAYDAQGLVIAILVVLAAAVPALIFVLYDNVQYKARVAAIRALTPPTPATKEIT